MCVCGCACVMEWMDLCDAGPIKVLDAVRRVKAGDYGSGAGCPPPPVPPAHPLLSRRDGRTGRPCQVTLLPAL